MGWNKDKSLLLSRVSVVLFFGAILGICISGPWLWQWLLQESQVRLEAHYPLYLLTTYTVAVPAVLALWLLWGLLKNLGNQEVFLEKNVRLLRGISWCCLLAGGVLFLSGFYDWFFFCLGAAAAFMGLIVRVVKNVVAQAVQLQQDNDFTI